MSSECHSPVTVVQPDKEKLLNNLSRIEGQIRGIHRMVEEDRYCVDILHQIEAVRASLRGVSKKLLTNHMRGCVAHSNSDKDAQAKLDELLTVLFKFQD
ncbi:MAG: metal-sensitive transcriptional regulator [Candidatus Cloacimonetes bacterium]|nr:metal-sensitive transcriptional regulator [Candidatus Cloacimonadota bacterium]